MLFTMRKFLCCFQGCVYTSAGFVFFAGDGYTCEDSDVRSQEVFGGISWRNLLVIKQIHLNYIVFKLNVLEKCWVEMEDGFVGRILIIDSDAGCIFPSAQETEP